MMYTNIIAMKEIWKTAVVDGKENKKYKVSSFGRVICLSWKRTGKPRLCRLSEMRDGYLRVWIDGVPKSVHRIVAETFIPNTQNKPFVDHINTIRNDNLVENLRWTTREENDNNPLSLKHRSENNPKFWLGKFGAEHIRSIQIVQLSLDGQFIKKWSSTMEVERELKIHHGHITDCCRGKRKSAGGYRWMYYSDYQKLQRKTIKDIKPLF